MKNFDKALLCTAGNHTIRVESKYIDFYKGKITLILLEDHIDVKEIQTLGEMLKFFIDNGLIFVIYINIDNLFTYLGDFPRDYSGKNEFKRIYKPNEGALNEELSIIQKSISTQLKRFNIDVESILTDDTMNITGIDNSIENSRTPIIFHKHENESGLSLNNIPGIISKEINLEKLMILSSSASDSNLSDISMLSMVEAEKKLCKGDSFLINTQKHIQTLVDFIRINPEINRGHIIRSANDLSKEIGTEKGVGLMVAAKKGKKVDISEEKLYSKTTDQVDINTEIGQGV